MTSILLILFGALCAFAALWLGCVLVACGVWDEWRAKVKCSSWLKAICWLILFGVFGRVICHGQSVRLTWKEAPDRLTGSAFVLHFGRSAGAYSGYFVAATNSCEVSAAGMFDGLNTYRVSQISTNVQGRANLTEMSGEVQVIKTPAVVVTAPLLASTNLGQGWQVVNTNTVIFPTRQQQQFFLAGQLRLARTNQLTLLPIP